MSSVICSSRCLIARYPFKVWKDTSLIRRNSLNCFCVTHVKVRLYSSDKLSRMAKGVYVPHTDGLVPARGSLANLPKESKIIDNSQRSKTSVQLFKSVMGDIYASKSKNLIAVEGARQVNDAISFGLKPKFIFLLKSLQTYPDNVRKFVEEESKESSNYFDTKPSTPEIHRISLNSLQEWSSLVTPPGIIGVFDKPKSVHRAIARDLLPLTVILDTIREPGNLGSIMRTAAGVGCKVLLSEGCVDPWETKSLRGGNGAQFLVPMTTKVDLQYLHQYIPLFDLTPEEPSTPEENVDPASRRGIGVFLADSGTGPDEYGIPIVSYTSVEYSKFNSVMLVLGGETSGLSKSLKQAVKELPKYYPEDIKLISRIKIPMILPIDSLNVANAFGIIGYEILRQMSINKTPM